MRPGLLVRHRHALNSLVLRMAPPHEARATAPGSFHDLMGAAGLARVPVWEGASEGTIYGDARVNHAFRAWHDAAHIAGGFAFTLAGERAACEYQIAGARKLFPRLPAWIVRAIRAEVTGQAEYFATHGIFPADQSAFFTEATNG